MTNIDIYVINLDKDVERLEQITQALKPNRFTRIQGILGKELNFSMSSPDVDDVFYTSKYLAPKSAIGCALSHRKALNYFLQHSQKDYVLILEDDAKPTTKEYMTEVQKVIENAPKDWNIIKLDSWPANSSSTYTTMPTLIATAYVINRAGAKEWLRHKVIYHLDFDMWFYNLRIYNSPTIVFEQIWDENYKSNNATNTNIYNPIVKLTHPFFSCSMIRLGEIELSMGDLILITMIIMASASLYKSNRTSKTR